MRRVCSRTCARFVRFRCITFGRVSGRVCALAYFVESIYYSLSAIDNYHCSAPFWPIESRAVFTLNRLIATLVERDKDGERARLHHFD